MIDTIVKYIFRKATATVLVFLGLFACAPFLANGANSVVVGLGTDVGTTKPTGTAANTIAIGNTATSGVAFNSVVIGVGAVSGVGSQEATAVGYNAQATQNFSSAFGYDAQATGGIQSLALGTGTVASAESATAIGQISHATQESSIAIGNNTQATGIRSVALGLLTFASGERSMALGPGARAEGASAIAIGTHVTGNDFQTARASAAQSIAVGEYAHASAVNAIAIGPGTNASAAGSVALGAGSVANQAYTISAGSGSAGDSGTYQYRRIVNVATPVDEQDAATKGYVDQQMTVAQNTAIDGIAEKISKISRRVDSVGAMQVSIANAQVAIPEGKTTAIGVGVGSFQNAKAATLGLVHRLPGNFQFSGNFSIAGAGEKAGGVGIGYVF